MLTEKQRQKIIDKLPSEPSDSKLAGRFGTSRTTVWRIRQEERAKQAKLKRAKDRMKSNEKKVPTVKSVRAAAVTTSPGAEQESTRRKLSLPRPGYTLIVPSESTEELHVQAKLSGATESNAMGTYFAAQLLRCEHIKDVANAIMQVAEARGVLFRKLQVLDLISVGTTSFVRFRTDLADPAAVLTGLNRGFISFSEGNYRITFADGRQGVRFPTTSMLSVQKSGFGQTYAGPKVKRWAQQFASAS